MGKCSCCSAHSQHGGTVEPFVDLAGAPLQEGDTVEFVHKENVQDVGMVTKIVNEPAKKDIYIKWERYGSQTYLFNLIQPLLRKKVSNA